MVTAASSSDQPAVGLVRREPLGPRWAARVETAIAALAARVADPDWARSFTELARSVRYECYTTDREVDMSAMYFPNETEVVLVDRAFDGAGGQFEDVELYFSWVITHELVHVLDHASRFRASEQFAHAVGSRFEEVEGRRHYRPGNEEGRIYATTISGGKSVFEDFAESTCMHLTDEAYMECRFGTVDRVRLRACATLLAASPVPWPAAATAEDTRA